MPFFIKTETIKTIYLQTKTKLKREVINEHKNWIQSLKEKGFKIKSGFLTNKIKAPGGGGVLIIECDSYDIAFEIVSQDPMIKKNLVDWELYEWIDILKN